MNQMVNKKKSVICFYYYLIMINESKRSGLAYNNAITHSFEFHKKLIFWLFHELLLSLLMLMWLIYIIITYLL